MKSFSPKPWFAPHIEKMELIVFDPIHHGYIQLGKKVGNAFSDGKALK